MSVQGQAGEALSSVVVIRCGPCRIGVPVHAVRRAVAAPMPMPLPGAPDSVAGLVNFHGTPLVVLDLAYRGAAARAAMTLESRLLIVDGATRPWGVLCERVEGTVSLPPDAWRGLADLMPGAGRLSAASMGEEDLIVLHDPDAFLSSKDEGLLLAALQQRKDAMP